MNDPLVNDAAKILNIIRKEVKRLLRSPDPDEVHDMSMDIYLACLKMKEEIRHPYTFVRYRAKYHVMSERRKANNRERLLRERGEDLLPHLSSDADDPADVAEAADIHYKLPRLTKELRDTVKALMTGMTYKEIADEAGITMPALYTRVHRLKEELKDE